MTGPSGRRPTRRKVLTALGGATVAVGLAGCSGGDDGSGDGDDGSGGGDAGSDGGAGDEGGQAGDSSGDGSDGDAGDGTADSDGDATFQQPENLGDPMASIHHNKIDEFVVLGVHSFVADGHEFVPDGRFGVDVRIGNNGPEPADPDGYIFSLSLHDANGDTIRSRTRTRAAVEEFPAGDSAIITLWDGGDEGADPAAVDAYELWIDCSIASADGSYCP